MTLRSSLSRVSRIGLLLSLCAGLLPAQTEDLKSSEPKTRKQAVEKLGKQGNAAYIPALQELLHDPVEDVRVEVVSSLIRIGGAQSLDPLIAATRDPVPEIQSLAIDGLVNFYVVGYVKFGWTAAVKSFGESLKSRFRRPDPVIIDPYLTAEPKVVEAIGRVITGGTSMESRANAARAAGILRGRAALPQLIEATRSKNTMVILEAVRAIEKIGERSVGPELTFLLRDLDEDVQLVVVELMGQLQVREAVPELVAIVKTGSKKKVQRQALIALAKMPTADLKPLFIERLKDKDKQLRAAAAEGIGRLNDPADRSIVIDALATEKAESARLSMSFAAVHLGDLGMLPYIYEGLNSTFHRGEARPFLIELARKPEVLDALYRPLMNGTKDQKIELAYIISISGNQQSMDYLKKLSENDDSDVAQAAIRAMKNLQARL